MKRCAVDALQVALGPGCALGMPHSEKHFVWEIMRPALVNPSHPTLSRPAVVSAQVSEHALTSIVLDAAAPASATAGGRTAFLVATAGSELFRWGARVGLEQKCFLFVGCRDWQPVEGGLGFGWGPSPIATSWWHGRQPEGTSSSLRLHKQLLPTNCCCNWRLHPRPPSRLLPGWCWTRVLSPSARSCCRPPTQGASMTWPSRRGEAGGHKEEEEHEAELPAGLLACRSLQQQHVFTLQAAGVAGGSAAGRRQGG